MREVHIGRWNRFKTHSLLLLGYVSLVLFSLAEMVVRFLEESRMVFLRQISYRKTASSIKAAILAGTLLYYAYKYHPVALASLKLKEN